MQRWNWTHNIHAVTWKPQKNPTSTCTSTDIYCWQDVITAQYDITDQKVGADCRESLASDVDGSILVLQFYLRDHFLVVGSALFQAHSSGVGTLVGGGGNRSLDAVTLLLCRLLTFHCITLQSSSMSPVKCVLLTEPHIRQSISSFLALPQPHVTCQLQKKISYAASGLRIFISQQCWRLTGTCCFFFFRDNLFS